MPAGLTVTWLYFGLAVWGALLTLTARTPAWLLRTVAPARFLAGWLTTELALHHLIGQAAITAVFVVLGVWRTPVGQVALLITLISWIGLVGFLRDARRDADTLRGALTTSLGGDYASSVPDDVSRRLTRPVSWKRVLLPFLVRSRRVERVGAIAYSEAGHRRNQLDVYRPKGGVKGAPVLMQIHGGAWIIGDKRQQGQPLVWQMAASGWVVVAVNYRLSPRATWPEHLVDCKRALAWIKENIRDYGGDPDRVVVTGGSAGGHLTAMVALTPNEARFQPGFEDVDTTVQGFVPFYGVFDWTNRHGYRVALDQLQNILEIAIVKKRRKDAPDLYDDASPLSHVSGAIPPALVIHGSHDTLAPVEEARQFVDDMREASDAPVAYAELSGAHHAFDVFPSLRTLHVVNTVQAFAWWVVGRSGGAPEG